MRAMRLYAFKWNKKITVDTFFTIIIVVGDSCNTTLRLRDGQDKRRQKSQKFLIFMIIYLLLSKVATKNMAEIALNDSLTKLVFSWKLHNTFLDDIFPRRKFHFKATMCLLHLFLMTRKKNYIFLSLRRYVSFKTSNGEWSDEKIFTFVVAFVELNYSDRLRQLSTDKQNEKLEC